MIPLLVLLWAAPLCTMAAQSQKDLVVVGESVQLQSEILQETRTLFVAKPTGYVANAESYPVLYLLDGERHFRYTAGIAGFLGENDRIPKMIIVGIASGNAAQRTRDLTPPSSAEIDNRFSPGNGGADAFLSFIAAELIPFVEKTYRTRPYRLLAGHSFGGLFGVYAMLTKPGLFSGYIVADPSLHWNNGAVAAQAESFLSNAKFLQADFYMAVAESSGKAPPEASRLDAALRRKAPAGFRWRFDPMKQDDHASIPLPSIYHGLESIFEDWRLTDPLALFDRGGVEGIHRRYREAGERFGYPERRTPAFTISLIVAAQLRAGHLEDASNLLLHDPKAYPPPWNQLDALARAYEAKGEIQKAAHYYRLSLESNPQNDFARKKLADLSGPASAFRP